MQLAVQAVANGVILGGIYALVALGITLLFGVMKIVNFAHGEFLMFGAYAAYWMYVLAGLDPLLSLPVSVLTMWALGYLLQRFVVGRIMDAPAMNQLLLTFGIALVLQNLALLLWTADSRSVVTAYTTRSVSVLGINFGLARVLGFVLAVALTLGLMRWLAKTEMGKATRAVAQNPQAAALMGINVRRIHNVTFGVSAALGGAAGVITSIILYTDPFVGGRNLIRAFAIAIFGGLGSLPGAILGALILGVTESTMSAYLPNGGAWAEGVFFLVILVVLAVRPRGLLGSRQGVQ